MKIICDMSACRYNEYLSHECVNTHIKKHEECPYYKLIADRKRDQKIFRFIVSSMALIIILLVAYIALGNSNGELAPAKDESQQIETKAVVEKNVCISNEPYQEVVDKESLTPIAPIETKHVKYDVPLDQDLQNHIFMLCAENDVDPAIVVAMIDQESKFTASIIGDGGNSFGLMQIQPRWHSGRMEKLGCTDLLDPYQNVTVGIDILAELLDSGKSIEWVLMAYNGGPAYANKKNSAGIVSEYASSVLSKSKALILA